MKKLTLFVALTMLLQMSFAGGLLTNYNQSAQYVRMLSRNAALEIDAVFYNPAGLVKLEDGWHFAFYSQTIFQKREIDSKFPLLNNSYYEGETTIPVFPNLYTAYKKDKWVFSLGIGPAAGGGTAEFASGIPSLEIPFSKAVPGLAGLGQIDPSMAVTGYDLDMSLEASSVYWGIQLGASYAISDKVSVFGGARIVPASNKYQGTISNIQFKAGGQFHDAAPWLIATSGQLTGLAGQASAGADQYAAAAATATGLSTQVSGAISAGLIQGTDPLSDPQLIGALQQFGIDPTGFTNEMAAGAFAQTAGVLEGEAQGLVATAATLNGTAAGLTATVSDMEDKEVDTKQTGLGITPIIGFNYSPSDDWNFAAKYEFKTKVTLTNKTVVDDLGLFPDGEEGDYDIPAIFTAGVGYRGVDWLEAQLSYNVYFDKGVDYGYNVRYKTDNQMVHRDIDKNHYELSLGLQFNLSDKFGISVGALRSQKGVAESYQSDFSFSNTANAVGGGIVWKITDQLVLDAAISNIFYMDDEVNFNDSAIGSYQDTYGKKTLSLAAGLSYSLH